MAFPSFSKGRVTHSGAGDKVSSTENALVCSLIHEDVFTGFKLFELTAFCFDIWKNIAHLFLDSMVSDGKSVFEVVLSPIRTRSLDSAVFQGVRGTEVPLLTFSQEVLGISFREQ